MGTGFNLKSSFTEQNEKQFSCTLGAENVDFAQSAQTANKINKWVSDQTFNKIADLVGDDAFNCDTRMVIVSAIAFKGSWKVPFSDTFDGIFDEKRKTKFMKVSEKNVFKIYQDDDVSFG